MSVAASHPRPVGWHQRDHRSDDAVVGLAREGVPTGAISRALAIPHDRVMNAVMRAVSAGELKVRPRIEWDDDAAHRSLRRRITELEDEVAEWRARANDDGSDQFAHILAINAIYGLTNSQAQILWIVAKRLKVTHAAIYHQLYGMRDDDGPDPNIIKVQLSKLRSKLSDTGLGDAIQTRWGMGYEMSADVARQITETVSAYLAKQKD